MIFKKKTTVFTQCDMRMFQCKKIYYCWSMVSLLGLPFVKKKNNSWSSIANMFVTNGETLWTTYPSKLGFCLVWFCISLVHVVRASLSSCVVIAFLGPIKTGSLLISTTDSYTLSVPLFNDDFWALGGGVNVI